MNKKSKRKLSSLKILVVFFAVVVSASLLFTNGLFPNEINSIPQNQNTGNIPAVPAPSAGESSLQINTFGFRTSSPTPLPTNCKETTAVDFLIDNSGSMNNDNKLTALKKGVIQFINALPDNSVIGMQRFSETPQEVIPFSYYKDVKSQVVQDVNSMTANGFTYTKDAFSFTKQELDSAIPKYPNYKFALIFVSDGVPETAQDDAANPPRAFATDQDPTEIATQIKQEGIRIFTVAYIGETDISLNNQLHTMMQNVASSPSDAYTAPSSSQISSILSQISTKLCQ